VPITVPVRISGDAPPYITAEVYCALSKVSGPVQFIVDTGAFDTTLSEDDAANIGADVDDLPESESMIVGVGGTVKSFDMEGVSVTFFGVGGQTRTVALDAMRVMENPAKRLDNDEQTFVPSLLGRRFMEEHGFTLFWDFPRRVAVLEIE
jgi:hypothetical protein